MFRRWVLIGVVVTLGGCSAAEPRAEAPPVASISRPPAVSVSASAAVPERPRQRLDDTEADYTARLKPYQKCMKAHGIVGEKGATGWASGPDAPKEQVAAQQACEMFWPLPPWEQDPANPEAKDFTRDVVKCLKSKGVKYVEPSEDGIGIAAGGDQNDSRSISLTGQYLDVCQRDVAAHRPK